ncbi:MAG: hypothetical protein WBD31_11905 [Rubripirellula sp.]
MTSLIGAAADAGHQHGTVTPYGFYVACLFVGFIAFLTIYFFCCIRFKTQPDTSHVMEAGIWGAMFAAGIHLAYCAYDPLNLVHFAESNGKHFVLPDNVVILMDPIHMLHLAAGGFGTVWLSILSLFKACIRHRETPVTESSPEKKAPKRMHARSAKSGTRR